MADKSTHTGKLVADNRKARFEYFISETVEAGVVLTGTEVKSLREGRANINDAYGAEIQGELWIMNLNIPEYKAGNRYNHEPKRPRKLLLHQKQIDKLTGQIKVKGFSLIPLKMYFNARGIAKILLGLGKGKKEHEKREAIKKRQWQREQKELLKK